MTPLLFMSFTMFGHTCLLSNLFARYLLVACNKVCMEYDSIVCCILCFTKKLKVGDYHQLMNSPRRQPKILLMNVDDNQNIILSRDKHRKIFYSNR